MSNDTPGRRPLGLAANSSGSQPPPAVPAYVLRYYLAGCRASPRGIVRRRQRGPRHQERFANVDTASVYRAIPPGRHAGGAADVQSPQSAGQQPGEHRGPYPPSVYHSTPASNRAARNISAAATSCRNFSGSRSRVTPGARSTITVKLGPKSNATRSPSVRTWTAILGPRLRLVTLLYRLVGFPAAVFQQLGEVAGPHIEQAAVAPVVAP